MKKTGKKWLALAMGLLMSASLAACGSSADKDEQATADDTGEKTTIQFWHSLTGANLEAINKVVKDYNESQDKVEVKASFQGNYDETSSKLQQAVASGNAPDLSMIGYGYVGDFQASDVVEDLTPYFEKAGIEKDDFIEGLMLESNYGDEVVTIPFNRSTPILHINKTAFEEAGLDIPTTWDEFSDVTNKLVEKDGNTITRYGSVMQKDTWFKFSMISQNNGRFYNEEGTGFDFIDNGIGHKIFTELKDLQKTGALYYSSSADAFEDTLKTFLTEKAPIAFLSSASSLAIEKSEPSFEYTTAFLPAGDKKAVATGGGNLAMLSSSKKKDAAWDFMEWLITNDKGAAAFTIETGYLPFTYSMTKSDAYQELYEAKPYRKTAFEQLEFAEDSTINAKHSVMLTEFYGAIEAIMYDDKDIDKTLETFKENGEQILND